MFNPVGFAVQVVPLNDSVFATFAVDIPPKATVAVCVPTPLIPLLAVFKFPVDVQDEPLYFSVAF